MSSNFVETKLLDLDLPRLKKECRRVNNKVLKTFENVEFKVDNNPMYEIINDQLINGTTLSRLYGHYNIFTFPYQGIYELYQQACEYFKEVCTYDQPYYVHGWLNYLQPGQPVPWHYHWKGTTGLDETYISTFYINAEPSTTLHKFADSTILETTNKNNTITIYEDTGDQHMVAPWQGEDTRVSISMDFVPLKYLQLPKAILNLNTWMPVV
jgi:hypothetical protein